jgi:hypothetical protein
MPYPIIGGEGAAIFQFPPLRGVFFPDLFVHLKSLKQQADYVI